MALLPHVQPQAEVKQLKDVLPQPKHSQKMHQITLKVSEEVYLRIKKMAKADDRTLTAWLRRRLADV